MFIVHISIVLNIYNLIFCNPQSENQIDARHIAYI